MSVTRRLAAACVVVTLVAVAVALSAGSSHAATAAVPTFLAIGAVCAALVAYLLWTSARAVEDDRLRWMAAGTALAGLGLLLNLMGQRTLLPGGSLVAQSADAMAARTVVWHAAFAAAGLLALLRLPASRSTLGAFTGISLLLLAFTCALDRPFGALVGAGGSFGTGLRIALLVLALTLAGTAAAWWRSEGRAPAWAAVCMIAALALSAADCVAYMLASAPYEGAWWASLTLRAGQFAVPAVGLVVGFVGMAERLRDLQAELGRNLAAERERAEREEAVAGADRSRRERQRQRIRRLIGGEGLDVALQPIVDLVSHEVVGAEALARFTEDGRTIDTESLFLDAHALGMGIELELAAVRLALASQDRLPDGLYLALNASPALLASDALLEALSPERSRSLVVELTEHQPVEDYPALGAALARLRRRGVRVAIDDVGSGFASFRHVTRVNPEILKLDRTLVCGIDEDPVRQSLASAIVAFAQDVGAIVVSEGIESEAELDCLRELAVGCGQGFFIARPNLGAVEASLPAPV